MVKISYKTGQGGVSDVEFIVGQHDSLEDITYKAIEFASATAQYATLNISSDWPIYRKDLVRGEQEQIGFIRITMLEEEYLVEHLTMSKEVIDSTWDVTDFYSGKYGLKDKEICSSAIPDTHIDDFMCLLVNLASGSSPEPKQDAQMLLRMMSTEFKSKVLENYSSFELREILDAAYENEIK